MIMGTEALRAFVISPIGGHDESGRDARGTYADEVFTKIIEPACEALSKHDYSLKAIRGDHDSHIDNIVDRFVSSINEDEIIIALLSEKDINRINANVFYELGIAHAAGRPVIMVRHQNQPLPFDIIQRMCIQYQDADLDGGLDPMRRNGPGYNLLAEMLDRLERKRFYEMPFGKDIALGRQGVRNRQNSISPAEWSSEILRAEREIWFAGTTMFSFANMQGFFLLPDTDQTLSVPSDLPTLLTDRVAHGVDVTIMLAHPDNPILSVIMRPQDDETASREAYLRVKQEAEEAFKLWSRHKDQALARIKAYQDEGKAPDVSAGKFRVIQVRHGAILHRMFATENRAMLTPNFYHMHINTTSCIDARPDAGRGFDKAAYAFILDELKDLARANESYESGASQIHQADSL